jgi:hypothetical protein
MRDFKQLHEAIAAMQPLLDRMQASQFAAAALMGRLSHPLWGRADLEVLADDAWSIAHAMMAERDRRAAVWERYAAAGDDAPAGCVMSDLPGGVRCARTCGDPDCRG